MIDLLMKNIESILKQISAIVEREKIQQEEKRKRGENFNIFSVLGLSTSEVRLHSAFLAELLNPNGDHGLGYKFLEAFLSIIIQQVKPGFKFDIKSAKVCKELSIGSITEDYTEGGQIDLLIRDDKNHAIVIENKIYAVDQKNQLLRYQNYTRKNFQEYILLYLTLDKKEADESSTDNKVDYQCISYKDEIIQWLNQCISISALFPKVRETIAQYKSTLENILNIMSEGNTKDIINVLINKDNVESTLTIISTSEDVKRTIRREFIKNLKDKLNYLINLYDLVFDDSDIDRFINLSRGFPQIRIYKKGHPIVSFALEVEAKEVSYGLCIIDPKSNNPSNLKMEKPHWIHPNGPNETWPHGYKYFDNDLTLWDSKEALLDMVNGDRIINTIINELENALKEKCFEDIENLISKQ